MVSLERLKQLLSYDSETGQFTWLQSRGGTARVGTMAGSIGPANHGYLTIKVDSRKYLVHRLAWFYIYGVWPHELDHINGNRVDNRIGNLRLATRAQNLANKFTDKSARTSIYKGVSRHKKAKSKPWVAQISVDNRNMHLGYYATAEAAHAAYVKAARQFFGEFVRLAEEPPSEQPTNES